MKIINLQVNHRVNPLGYQLGYPDFTWNYEAEVTERIETSRIVVTQDNQIIADTGYTTLNNLGTTLAIDLQPRTRYAWYVLVQLADQSEVQSDIAWFETGKMDEAWLGQWITTSVDDERHPIFTKAFDTTDIKRARLYISGLGLFHAKINDKQVSDELLMPYCNDYEHWIQSLTFDVTDLLQDGNNTLSITLGNGWYRGRFGFDASNTGPCYGDEWKLICELHITTSSGETVIVSDDSWSVTRSNITFSNIYDGEHRDDTLLPSPKEEVRITSEEVPLVDRRSIPVVRQEKFIPKLIRTPKDEYVLDIGQNLSGIFSFRVHEPFGAKVHLQFGEVLQDGCFYRDNLRTAKSEYIYISDGYEHVLEPEFTFYGFRYIKVEGITNLSVDDFVVHAIYSDIRFTSNMVTGNAKVNQLISNCLWGMKSNYVDVPTDCPQRDERMGWTGDAQVFSATAMYFADTYAFFEKYLYDMYQEQCAHGGLVPFTIPSVHIHQAATVWGDACTIIPFNLYTASGDIRILSDQYDSMKAWVDYIHQVDGNDHGWRKQFHFGDWLALDGPKGPEAVKGRTDEAFIADVYYHKSCLIVAESAHLLGIQEDEVYYRQLAEDIRKDLMNDYYTPSGRCAVMTMTAQVLSLQEGLGNPNEAITVLKKLFSLNNGKLETGFTGTPLLCPVCTEYGMQDIAYNLLLNEEYPGWLYEVNLGATTIWERWNSLDEEGHITGIGMNSLNHYSYGSIAQWLFAYVAGIKPRTPGYKRAIIEPVVDARLGSMDCSYTSSSGTYHVMWKIVDRYHIEMEFDIPYGCAAEVHFPYFAKSDNPIAIRLQRDFGNFTQGHYHIIYETNTACDTSIGLKTVVKEALKNEKIKEYLEKIPLFAQSEYSFLDLSIQEALQACRTDRTYQEIENDLYALQEAE